MAIKTFTTGEVLTASDTNTYLANSGLVYVTSTTVTGSSLVAIDNCFTSTYDNYLIIVNVYGSANSYGKWRFRASGTAATTGYYFTGFYSTVAGLSNYTGSGVADLNGAGWGASSSIVSSDKIEVFNPKTSTYTGFKSTLYDYSGNPTGYSIQGHREPAVAYDGIQMTPASGTVTGTFTVYGYRKV